MDGKIYYCKSKKKLPAWKKYLEELSTESIDISENVSNKAAAFVRIKDKIMAIVFGHGRSFLNEECIERNFGLKVALNTINQNKMRSVNSATIEDMVVTTQRQASYSTTQDEFELDITDIMRGLTGEPHDAKYGKHMSGKDSLVISVSMELHELKSKLLLYYEAYKDERYKSIGFGWVDNVAEIRDSTLSKRLDSIMANAIANDQIEHLHIAPPETIDWDRIIGFCYSGIGKNIDKSENYDLDLDLTKYTEKIKSKNNICDKIRNDKLYAIDSDDSHFSVGSIYKSLVFQTEYEGKNYILCSGTWYYVETSFFEQVNNFIINNIPPFNLRLPDCPSDKDEGKYNEMLADGNKKYCLMDKKLIKVKNSPKQIEACDIFTQDNQFIHIKNKGQSAQLSHLFSQGKVSAMCFVSDEEFRKQFYDLIHQKFTNFYLDYTQKPKPDVYEVVYAIIDTKDTPLEIKLPFFSKVNLMMTAQELERMHFRFSVCLVKKEITP